MISFDNISKSYGTRVLFESVSFNINPRERIGLIGRNGNGKTTLMRMIIGEEEHDSGIIAIPKDYHVGYLSQHIKFSKSSVLEEAMTGFKDEEEAFFEYKAEKILSGLGFMKEDMVKDPLSFSGGYQVRLNLAKVLLSSPNMLLLDEPTNYLDIVSIRWLKSFLTSWQGELILITHDRFFMDDVITHTLGIHRGMIRKIAGNTSKFYEQIAKDEEVYEKTRVNDEQKRKEMQEYITRFRAKARLAGLVQSRIKTLAKMEKKEQLKEIKSLEFSFRYKQFNGKQVMRAENISFGYTADKKLIDNLSVIVGSEDRLCIIGKNGKGKSTLLRILAGELKPDTGLVIHHNGAVKGYFEQTNISTLCTTNTVEEEIGSVSDNFDRTYVRSICGAMLFSQDDALKQISVLSGGEKSRVMLGKIIAKPLNIIMLDEPTNHLDMDSIDSLIEALDDFEGALIMVTHNEMLLEALATKLIVFQGDSPFLFDGGYNEFLETVGFADDEANQKSKKRDKGNKKDIRKLKADMIQEKARVIKPLEEEIKRLENLIATSESEIKVLTDEATYLASNGEGVKIKDIAKKLNQLENLIEESFNALDVTTKLLENKIKEFPEQ